MGKFMGDYIEIDRERSALPDVTWKAIADKDRSAKPKGVAEKLPKYRRHFVIIALLEPIWPTSISKQRTPTARAGWNIWALPPAVRC